MTSFPADCKSAGTSIFECHRQAQTPKENKSNDVAEIVLIISEVSTGSTSEDKKNIKATMLQKKCYLCFLIN